MNASVVKCSNCGKISERKSVLPLCPKCLEGLKDYEDFCRESTKDVEINLKKKPPNFGQDDFLKI
jgi:hypothetical protein